MSFWQMVGDLANAAVEGIGAHQVQQQTTQQTGGQRTIKRKAGCTPCAAQADVDSARKQLGFDASKPAKATKTVKAMKTKAK